MRRAAPSVRVHAVAQRCAARLVVAWSFGMGISARAELPPDETVHSGVQELSGERTERSWLYLDEAHVARPLETLAMSRVTYTSVGASPTRPFSSNIATPGAMVELGGEVGVLPRLSLQASAVTAQGGAQTSWGAVAGARLSILPDGFKTTGAVVSVGFLRELSGANGAWGRASFSQEIDRVRLGTTLHLEHVFDPGRDSLDFMVLAGANVKLLHELRAGVEYVGEDLEESVTREAEGGVRHFAGPSASVALVDQRLTITGGPSFGLSSLSPRLVGRLTLSMLF